jgi:lysyl-tRNA synthetase class 2
MSMRRAAMLERIRRYFADTGALEVTTPALVQAPVTDVHIESLEVFGRQSQLSGFLQTSPEYAMKRLLCAGWPDIYQISPVFRGGERGRLHNPEFAMIEWYRLGIDHHALMDDVDRMLRAAFHIALQPESSKRLTYQDAFVETLELDPFECPLGALQEAIAANGIPVPNSLFGQRDALLDIALSSIVAHRFPVDRITFLYDFPASQAALARIRGPVASRFEAFWGETELANGFHELVDPAEQKLRFEADLAGRRSRGQPSPAPDQRFLAALAAGLPDCAGVAMGLDRMLMIASGAARIDDVIAFPFERA